MALYDNFPDIISSKPGFVLRMEQYRQRKISQVIARHLKAPAQPRVLEVGIGTGLLAKSCREMGWDYVGIDRNQKMVDAMASEFKVMKAEVPPFEIDLPRGTFDVTYAAGVFEHMRDGIEAYYFIEGFSAFLRPGGLMVLVMPDCMSLGMEFWNLDYTHRFPTMERNVAQILHENHLTLEHFCRYRGPFITGLPYGLMRLLAYGYSYRMLSTLFGHRPFLYSVYQYVKQDIMLFVARKP